MESARDVLRFRSQEKSTVVSSFTNIKAVLFDFYNTLAEIKDDEGNIRNFEAILSLLPILVPEKWLGSLPSAEVLRESYFGEIRAAHEKSREQYPDIDLEMIWAAVLAGIGIPVSLLYDHGRAALRKVMAVFRNAAVEFFTPERDGPAVLRFLRAKGLRIGIISDAQTEYAVNEMMVAGVLPLLDCLVMSAEFRFQKPDRRLFECALNRMRVRPSEVVHVGDHMYRDIMGAKQVGIHTVFKRSMYGERFAGHCTPEDVIRDIGDLPRILGFSDFDPRDWNPDTRS